MTIDQGSGCLALAELGLKAVDLFGRLMKAVEAHKSGTWPEDSFVAASERFELWAANMGLFVAGHGSLDYRVREAEKLAQTLRRFIQDLNTSLEDLIEMCSEEDAFELHKTSGDESVTDSEDEDEDEENWDMELLTDSINDPINRLFKMSTKIRNPSTRLGSSRAADYRLVDEDTGVDLLQAMKRFDLDYVRTMFLEYRKTKARRETQFVEAPKLSPGENDDEVWEPIRTVLTQKREQERTGTDSCLIARIAHANVRRRQQFAYWARHRHKLEEHKKAFQAQRGQLPVDPSHRAGEIPLEFTPGDAPSVTTATRVDISRFEVPDYRSNRTLSEYAPSTRQAADAHVEFPPAPTFRRKAQTVFECPYCFFLCPKEILADKAWKAHLIHDLRPYICTYEDCRTPTQMYDSRKDWVQHEQSVHRKVWKCLEHRNKVYESLDAYRHHLQEQHSGSIGNEDSLTRIIQASESSPANAKRHCPICTDELDTSRVMEGHIALHLERFARFSLPRSVSNDDDDSIADSGMANRVDEEGSRDDDFEGGPDFQSETDVSENLITGRPPEAGSSIPQHGVGDSGGILPELQGIDDDGGTSSESDWVDSESSGDLEVGEWCTDFEKYEEVELRYRDALLQAEKTMGREHPDTLDKMASLAELLRGQMKWMEAEQICRKTRELREKVLGQDHPDTLTSMARLGTVLFVQDKYSEAESVEREVLELRQKVLDPEHPDTLLSMSNLATTLTYLGQSEEAEELCVRSMETRRRALGPTHIDTLDSESRLIRILRNLGRDEEAHRLAVALVETCKQHLGPGHRETLNNSTELAALLWERGRFEDAKKLKVEVLQAREGTLGPAHPSTLLGKADLGETFWREGRFEEAEKLQAEVLEVRGQKLGFTHPVTIAAMYYLACNWQSQGRLAEAIKLMEECLQLRRQVLGSEHRHTLEAAEDLEQWRAELE